MKKLIAILLLGIFLLPSIGAAEEDGQIQGEYIDRSNWKVTASRQYLDWGGEKAIDGILTDESSLKIENVAQGDYVEIDLGKEYCVSALTVETAKYTPVNHIKIMGSRLSPEVASPIELASYEGSMDDVTADTQKVRIDIRPNTVRYIRLECYQDTNEWMNLGELSIYV